MSISKTRATVSLVATAALVAGGVGLAPGAFADDLAPHTDFTMTIDAYTGAVTPPASGEDIPNIDSVKSTLRAYYGATKQDNPANPGQLIYTPDLVDSPYAVDVQGIADQLLTDFPENPEAGSAIAFDVDSTLLSDYANEEEMGYNYSPSLNAAWVTGHLFPAMPGMPGALETLKARGYALYAITGRPGSQENDTVINLTDQGYVDVDDNALFNGVNTFTKDLTNQPWVDCTADGNPACSTVEYKALTRDHIETTDGVHFVGNVGDQWSDLMGGHADAAVKIPNPTYYLPSLDLTGAPAGDADMHPPAEYTMAPDGSSAATVESGDDIPNIGLVTNEIRAYFNATNGISNKNSSSYISDVKALEQTWGPEIAEACATGVRAIAVAKDTIARGKAALSALNKQIKAANAAIKKAKKAKAKAKKALKKAKRKHNSAAVKKAKKQLTKANRALKKAKAAKATAIKNKKLVKQILADTTVPGRPAAVFDADDTTLWTYDMEDGAMKFNFNPTVQNDDWVMPAKFPATPGMPEMVNDIADAGCTIIGLTGRGESQKYATVKNLSYYYGGDFRANNYYTKPATMPSYLDCGDDDVCSTIEYKAGTRKYIEEGRGFDIVANLGDQYSDLIGGYADKTYKLPNPTYYLP